MGLRSQTNVGQGLDRQPGYKTGQKTGRKAGYKPWYSLWRRIWLGLKFRAWRGIKRLLRRKTLLNPYQNPLDSLGPWLIALVVMVIAVSAGVAWGFSPDRSPSPQSIPVPLLPTAPPTPELSRSGRYQLNLGSPQGNLSLEVDSQTGGRITRFALDGRNVLQGPEIDGQNYGSTLWVSPQAVWDWPPPAAIDRAPYQVTAFVAPSNSSYSPDYSLDSSPDRVPTLSLTSPPSPTLGLQIHKTFRLDRTPADLSPRLTLTYSLTNTQPQPVSYAPWEVSRVSPTGLTFYGASTDPWGVAAFAAPQTQRRDGVVWWDHGRSGRSGYGSEREAVAPGLGQSPVAIGQDQKLFGDASEGWLAHLEGNLLFLKVFRDTAATAQAPGEGEIEVYANGGQTYVEMEVQGAYQRLAPGQSRQWQVQWSLHRLPAALENAQAGDRALTQWVRQVVAQVAA